MYYKMFANVELFYEMAKTKKVILFGASSSAEKVIGWNNIFKNFKISYFCDNDEEKWNSEFMGVQVLPPTQLLKENENDCVILITSSYIWDIKKLLNNYGFYNNIFYHYILVSNSENLTKVQNITYKNLDKVNKVNEIWADATSREIFKQIIIKRLSRCPVYCDIKESGQYFRKDVFDFSKHEVYVDAGTFNGDTIQEFINIVDGEYRKIYGFEPDRLNFQKARSLFENKDDIKISQYRLWGSDTILTFREDNSILSGISDEGNIEIETIRLDDFIKEKITFIKMDIEGAEMEAIKGAKNVILKYKPKLAICIYHKPEDLWEIPMKIKELVPEYKLYIKQHGGEGSETVLYATL